jgi:hypothetical protein
VTEPVYVYGVLPAADARSIDLSGIRERSVRTVVHDELCAAVSDLDTTTLAAAREVRAHWRVLDVLAEHATIVPTRFGTVMDDDRAVRDRLLAPNASELARMLRDLHGRVQLSVKGAYDEERILRDVVASSPAIDALRRRVRTQSPAAGYYDRIRLGEAVAGVVARRRRDDTELALAYLEPLAVAVRAEETTSPDAAFALSCLVERDAVDAFGAGVGALRATLGDRVGVEFVGPLPPYTFAEARLTVAGGAGWD